VSRSAEDRFEDILAAIERTLAHRRYLDADDRALASMAYDAVLRNLAVIGEAVRALPDEAKSDPTVPWAAIAGLRNVVIHEYFRVDPAMIQDIVDHELVPLAELIRRGRGPQE